MDDKNVKLDINIAGEIIHLTVPFSRQNAVRDTERHLASLFTTWRTKFPSKSDKEIIAMIAYQYASFYDELLTKYDAALEAALDCEEFLDKALESPDPSPRLS